MENNDIQNEILLEQLWNNNKISKIIHQIVINMPWFESFCKEHSQYPKVKWHRLFSLLLIYKRLEITVLVGLFRKSEPDTNKTLEFLTYAENNNVLIWDDTRNQYYLNNLRLTDEVQAQINLWQYPMPLICKPKKLTSNYQSPYLLVPNENVVLNSTKHFDDINLEHINRVNSISYSVNLDVAKNCQNVWEPKTGNTEAVKTNLKRYMHYCYQAVDILNQVGNKFNFSHRYDERGRTYPKGYYLNPQGTDYNKASLEFANKEVCK